MNMFCDTEAVFKNSSIPDSTLKKKAYLDMLPPLQGGCRQPHGTGSQRGDPDELERLVHETDATSEP